MIKYIKSEIYRVFKTPMYKRFLLISLIVMTSFLFILDKKDNYMDFMGLATLSAVYLVSSIVLIFTFKTKDTKVQILSNGIKRTNMYIADWISINLIMIITVVIMACIAIAVSFLGKTLHLVKVEGLYIDYIEEVCILTLFTININTALFGFAYIVNNVAISIVSNFVLIPSLLNSMTYIFKNENAKHFFMRLYEIQPHTIMKYNVGRSIADFDYQTIFISVLFTLVVYFLCGLVAFNKREIY